MNNDALSLRVMSYSGYRGEETPQRFFITDRPVDVIDVIDRWLEPDHCYFKVVGDDNATYILRHDVELDRWELTMFDSGLHPEAHLSSTAREACTWVMQ